MSRCDCTDTEVCFPCRDREAHRAPEPEGPVYAFDADGVGWVDEWDAPPPAEAPVYAVDADGAGWADWWSEPGPLSDAQMEAVKARRSDSPPLAEAPDVEPATDDLVETLVRLTGRDGIWRVSSSELRALIARVRQAEERADQWRERRWECARRADGLMARVLDAEAEVARLREQLTKSQAPDGGAFW